MTLTREQEIALCDSRTHRAIVYMKRTAREFDRRAELVAALRDAAEDVADEIEQERDAVAVLEHLHRLPVAALDSDDGRAMLKLTGILG